MIPKLYGMNVYQSPFCAAVPNFTLSSAVQVPQEFRDEFNAWAREFFGAEDRIIKTKDGLFVSPKTFQHFYDIGLLS